MYIYIHIYTYIHVYIYIYIERERYSSSGELPAGQPGGPREGQGLRGAERRLYIW